MKSSQGSADSSHNGSPTRTFTARTPTSHGDVTAEQSSSHRFAFHTPLGDTIEGNRQSVQSDAPAQPGGNSAPMAIRRAVDQQRNDLTPSGKAVQQSPGGRETPMDILHRLAGALAHGSKPFVSSSPAQHSRSGFAETRERSVDGSSDSAMPLSSRLDEDNFTYQSPELPQGSLNSQAGRASSRSLGVYGDSDALDTSELTGDVGQQSDFFQGTFLENIHAQANAGADSTSRGMEADSWSGTLGRSDSEFGPQVLDSVDETTIFMSDTSAHGSVTSPFVGSFAETGFDNVAAEGGQGDTVMSVSPAVSADDNDNDDDDMHHKSKPKQGFPGGKNDDEQRAGKEQLKPSSAAKLAGKPSKRKRRQRRISKHGLEYPTLAPTLVKRVAQAALQSSGLSNSRISPDTLTALTQASEWFFEQLGGDLGAYANHAGRKAIDDSDVVLLMRRQNQITPDRTLFSLAERHLPRGLLQELRMPVPVGGTRRKRLREEETTGGKLRDVGRPGLARA